MRKKLAYGLAVLSILLVVSATCNPAAAATYTVGVSTGTKADYSYSQTNVTPNRVNIDVTSVTTTVVTYTRTTYNPDNSVNNTHAGLTYDVTDLSTYSAFLWFIGANLTATTPVYPGALYIVNQTISSYSIAGATRTVNHSNQTFSALNIPYLYFNGWWDKPTGLLVKLSYHWVGPGPAYWVNLTLTGTSLWTPGYGTGGGLQLSTTTLLLIGVGAVVIIAIIVVLVRRK